MLRHLWSLAIEEQFYLLWPLAFVALMRSRMSTVAIARLLAGLAAAVVAWTFWAHGGGPGPVDLFGGIDRVNFLYLSTLTRASGLLLGAAAAFVWRPWRSRWSASGWAVPQHALGRPQTLDRIGLGRGLDVAGAVALTMLGCIAGVATLTDGYVYQWLLALVTALALVAVLVVVHPAATGMRAILGWAPLVAVGRRSYGLYLWHWPIFVLTGATDGAGGRFAIAMAVTVVLSELSYRYVELPVRRGALGRGGAAPARRGVVRCSSPRPGWSCSPDATSRSIPTTAPREAPTPPSRHRRRRRSPRSPRRPLRPRRVTIVGDSQAHSLAVNLPDGIEATFAVTDGSLDGCSVHDAGRVHSARTSFSAAASMVEGMSGFTVSIAERIATRTSLKRIA